MVMEYCDKGNLNSKITETPGNVLSIDETFYITYDIIKGLEYMHKKNIIHRDIKAENILLISKKETLKSKKSITQLSSTNLSQLPLNDYLTKICDLGFATEEDESVNTFCGTTCYMAPEIFSKSNYTNKVDIWALGVLIFYMVFGEFPFKSNFCLSLGLNVEFEIEKKCNFGFKISNVAMLKPNESISKQDYLMLDEFFRKIFVTDPDKRLGL